MTLTHDVAGRQLPWVIVPARELGHGLLHTSGPRAMPGQTKDGSQERQRIGEC